VKNLESWESTKKWGEGTTETHMGKGNPLLEEGGGEPSDTTYEKVGKEMKETGGRGLLWE